MSLSTVLKALNFIKKRLQHRCSRRTTPVAAFEVSFSIRKEFKKKKVSGEITFALINLFHVQIPEPASRSATTTAFVFLTKFAEFYYLKIFKTRS